MEARHGVGARGRRKQYLVEEEDGGVTLFCVGLRPRERFPQPPFALPGVCACGGLKQEGC